MTEKKKNQEIMHSPHEIPSRSRRRFMHGLLGTAAAASFSRFDKIAWAYPDDIETIRKTSAGMDAAAESEPFWMMVKNQFSLRKGLIMLNAANLCPSPFPVQRAVFNLTRSIDRDPSSHNRSQFQERLETSRESLARYLGAEPDEIAIIRNTSEGNNMVINGLTFQQGDEVVIWDENHPTANIAWDIRAERYGFVVKRVRVPEKITSPDDLVQPFLKAVTSKTRLLSFSHLSNISGIALPASEICSQAAVRGVLTHIDGAQTFGSQKVNLHELGCDFYTGSSHKWFLGPKEVGVLYVKKNRIPELWPTIVGVGYPQARRQGARKFETLGQRDDARIAAMATAAAFHQAVGGERIESRIKRLADVLRKKLQSRISSIQFRTPLDPSCSGGVIVFNIPGLDLPKALDILYKRRGIGCAVFGGDLAGIRMCPHIYNTLEEMELAAEAVASLGG